MARYAASATVSSEKTRLETAYQNGRMPALMPGTGAGRNENR